MPVFSCVICTRNRAHLLPATLDCLGRLEKPEGWTIEVVVVDNASTDGTAEVARAHAIKPTVVVEARPGTAHARHLGWWTARGELVCFVDDDNLLDADYARRAIGNFAARDDLGQLGGCGRLPGDPPPWFAGCQRMFACGPQGDPDGAAPDYIYGAGSVMRRACGDQVFAEDLEPVLVTRGEDMEMGFFARAAGWTIRHDPLMTFIHAVEAKRLNEDGVLYMAYSNGQMAPTLWRYRREIGDGRERLLQKSDRIHLAPLVARMLRLRHALRRDAGLQSRITGKYLAGVIDGLGKPSVATAIRANIARVRANPRPSPPPPVPAPAPAPRAEAGSAP